MEMVCECKKQDPDRYLINTFHQLFNFRLHGHLQNRRLNNIVKLFVVVNTRAA